MNLATALRGALLIILVGTALGLAHNALSPQPVPWKPVPKTTLSLDDLVPEDPAAAAAEDETDGDPPPGSLEEERAAVADPPPAIEEENEAPEEAAQDLAAEARRPVAEDQGLPPENDEGNETPQSAAGNPGPETEKAPSSPASAGGDYADIPESEFPFEVSLARAKSLYDRGGLRVLDAREHEEYTVGHIKGAESAPFDVMVGDIEWLENTAADPRPLLVYCDGTDCEVSLNLGFEISQSGHRRVLVLDSGFKGWAEAGFPTSTGEQP